MTRTDDLYSLAERILAFLSPGCDQVDIAGTLRRGGSHPKDIDIVCQPKTEMVLDLFGEESQLSTLRFDRRRDELESMFNLEKVKGASRLHQYISRELNCSIDLFVVLPPAQYGALLAIRTGPADFAKLCVTSRLERPQGGAMPPNMKQQDGALWRSGAMVETPTEEEWFKALELPCWPPARRSVHGLRMYLDREVVQSR